MVYDVFISAKSQDYPHARVAAEFLRRAGLRVFFSEHELPEMGNSDYFDAIDTALEGSHHMLVVTSSLAHVSSPWVKKEWQTYLSEELSGRKSGNVVTLLCGRMSIEDLPISLRQHEARPSDDLPSLLKYFGDRDQAVPTSPSVASPHAASDAAEAKHEAQIPAAAARPKRITPRLHRRLYLALTDPPGVKELRKAAHDGDADAQDKLGESYRDGFASNAGLEKSEIEAVRWFEMAADQGLAAAQNNLGGCYERGAGIAADVTRAAACYRKAADQGHADAQYNLGLCYLRGAGVPKDDEEAVKWFQSAADNDVGLPPHNEKFVLCAPPISECFDSALGKPRKGGGGHANAQYRLGECYENGTGVTKDEAEAVKWYRRAADKGHTDAQQALGRCYKWGIGVERNESESAEWYNNARSPWMD